MSVTDWANFGSTKDLHKGANLEIMNIVAFALRIWLTYSEVPNKSVTFFIPFWDFFLPTWPYDLHTYSFLGKFVTYTVFYLLNIKKFPPTRPY